MSIEVIVVEATEEGLDVARVVLHLLAAGDHQRLAGEVHGRVRARVARDPIEDRGLGVAHPGVDDEQHAVASIRLAASDHVAQRGVRRVERVAGEDERVVEADLDAPGRMPHVVRV